MVNEGDKEEMELQGNDDIVLIIIVKCKVGKWFQVNKFICMVKFVYYIKKDRVFLVLLVIVVNKIFFFNVINLNLYLMC